MVSQQATRIIFRQLIMKETAHAQMHMDHISQIGME